MALTRNMPVCLRPRQHNLHSDQSFCPTPDAMESALGAATSYLSTATFTCPTSSTAKRQARPSESPDITSTQSSRLHSTSARASQLDDLLINQIRIRPVVSSLHHPSPNARPSAERRPTNNQTGRSRPAPRIKL
ncbi:hypothetical protein M409DRAFT_60760 [Zasmidium cellare ATCC 36951]|uniref:Uncharacterized protein n=1 Tax=Zasmidium cellare ATCC 36951 TaxID=1080233 RepID=A0A6A6C155_ZASCE|nr:uncharacterized protein M409DRAFT_60760 [Zasmidium cellare ATCC 36951]KAF2159549.1 hypothetical protein M409DRAFT_60760 [Zasmidium cellare ATCC 36951]